MPDLQGKISELSREAEAAIGAASDTAELVFSDCRIPAANTGRRIPGRAR